MDRQLGPCSVDVVPQLNITYGDSMYQNVGLSAGGITTGIVGVTLLPKTGGFRFMFVISVIAFTFGLAILLATAVFAIKKRLQKN